MLRVGFYNEVDGDFYEHEHVEYTGQSMEELAAKIEISLQNFIDKHKIPS